MNESSSWKVAVVTGSGRRRVGNEVARQLAADGYRVALHYHHSRQPAEETVDELLRAGHTVVAIQADVSDEQQVDRMFDQVLAQFGRLDLLVTTASLWQAKRLDRITAADVWSHFQVDALGTFLCARRAGLIMVNQPDGGAIVTIGDWALTRPYTDYAAYFLAKGTIPTLTRVLAVELGLRNPRVRVNCILPGPVMFPDEMSARERERVIQATLVNTANCPNTVAQAVRFFAENQFVTGTCLPVDGGRTVFAPGDQ